RTIVKRRGILLQFRFNEMEIGNGISAVGWQRVHEMEQETGAFNVAQEFVAQPSAGVRAFDQAWQVGNDDLPEVAGFDDAQLRLARGEWIRSDLRPRGADAAEQRALAGVGQADKAHVGDEFQFEMQLTVFALMAFFGEARRLMR